MSGVSESPVGFKDATVVRQDEDKPKPRRRFKFRLGYTDQSWVPVDIDENFDYTRKATSIDDFEHQSGHQQGSVFEDAEGAEFYKPIEKYEGRHRFVPDATWTPEEERRLVRTVSLS